MESHKTFSHIHICCARTGSIYYYLLFIVSMIFFCFHRFSFRVSRCDEATKTPRIVGNTEYKCIGADLGVTRTTIRIIWHQWLSICEIIVIIGMCSPIGTGWVAEHGSMALLAGFISESFVCAIGNLTSTNHMSDVFDVSNKIFGNTIERMH